MTIRRIYKGYMVLHPVFAPGEPHLGERGFGFLWWEVSFKPRTSREAEMAQSMAEAHIREQEAEDRAEKAEAELVLANNTCTDCEQRMSEAYEAQKAAEKRASLFAAELDADNSDYRCRAEKAEVERDAAREQLRLATVSEANAEAGANDMREELTDYRRFYDTIETPGDPVKYLAIRGLRERIEARKGKT